MSTESTTELLKQWALQELTLERATGQVLQHLARLSADNDICQAHLATISNTLQAINITLTNLRHDVDALIAHTAMPPPKTKRRHKTPSPLTKG